MGDTYHFNVSKTVVHITHMLVGLWLVYLGFSKLKKQEVDEHNNIILIVLGVMLVGYFLLLLYKNYKKEWQYAFGVPNYVVHITHILNGILFLLLGTKKIDYSDNLSLYLVIYGALGSLYHSHLMYLKI